MVSEEIILEIEKLEKKSEKYQDLWNLAETWLQLKERKIKIADYLLEQNIRTIAIYGLSKLGIHLAEELRDTDVTVSYGIDKNGSMERMDFPVYPLGDNLPIVNAVILTMHEGEQLKWKMEERLNCQVITLKELLHECKSMNAK